MNSLSRTKIILWLSGIALGLCLGGFLLYQLQYRNSFYPGVIIAGAHVSGRPYQEVLIEKLKQAQLLAIGGINLTVATKEGRQQTVNLPMSSQGLTPDTVVEYFSLEPVEKVVAAAYRYGREGSIYNRLKQQVQAWFFGAQFNVPVVVRENALGSLLEREVDTLLQRPRDAYFKATAGSVTIVPEVTGEAVDSAQTIAAIKQAATTLTTDLLPIFSERTTPAVRAVDLQAHLTLAEKLAQYTEVVFTYGNRAAYASGNTLASWLTVDSQTKRLALNPELLETFIAKQIDTLTDEAPANSRFKMSGGVLTEIIPGRAGKAVHGEVLARTMLDRIAQINTEEPLAYTVLRFAVPVTVREPAITASTIGRYKITDLLGTARTSLGSSGPSRRQNIRLGIERINGLLIAPGEEFSTVNAIGYVTEEAGFEPEFVIKGQESVKELGGGLCQVSTTLFRGVLASGLPVTERQNHKYVVGYYGAGLDATIYGPHPDLRFVNDTGNYILVQGRVEGNEAVFEIYGVKDGRTATVSEVEITDRVAPPEPKYIPTTELAPGDQQCTEIARAGLTAKATYQVRFQNGQTRTQDFISTYQPWQKVCLVGVGQQSN